VVATTSYVVTVVCVRIKWTVLDTKSTTVITASNPINSKSSTIKFTLMVSHYTFSIIVDVVLPVIDIGWAWYITYTDILADISQL